MEKPICETCGSVNVRFDAWAEWENGEYVVAGVQDYVDCIVCGGETSVMWVDTENLYRSKPALVQAFQMTEEAAKDTERWPKWLRDSCQESAIRKGHLMFRCRAGALVVCWRHYIVKSGDHIFSLSPLEFEPKYVRVEE